MKDKKLVAFLYILRRDYPGVSLNRILTSIDKNYLFTNDSVKDEAIELAEKLRD